MLKTVLNIFFWVNFTLFFHVWIATHIPKFSIGTFPLNFTWLSHNTLSFFSKITNLLVSFCYHTLITLMLCELSHFFACFSEWNCPPFIWVNVIQISFLSPLFLCECRTCAFSFSLCECHTYILVSALLLSGQYTLFPCGS